MTEALAFSGTSNAGPYEAGGGKFHKVCIS